jgi:hypothetical protein
LGDDMPPDVVRQGQPTECFKLEHEIWMSAP